MRSLPAALTWEVLHRGRWALLASFAGVLLFPLLIFGALKRDGALDPSEPGLIMVQVILTQVGVLGASSDHGERGPQLAGLALVAAGHRIDAGVVGLRGASGGAHPGTPLVKGIAGNRSVVSVSLKAWST